MLTWKTINLPKKSFLTKKPSEKKWFAHAIARADDNNNNNNTHLTPQQIQKR